jgi:hypothetical protein
MADSPKRIGIAADHGGFESEAYLVARLGEASPVHGSLDVIRLNSIEVAVDMLSVHQTSFTKGRRWRPQLFAAVGHNCELNLTLLDIKVAVRGIPSRKDDLILVVG